MSTAVPGRVVCARCGANNFDTQAACWKCGAPLTAGSGFTGGQVPPSSGARLAPPVSPTAVPASAPAPEMGYRPVAATMDPSVATWSAIALALFFPFVAVPVGVVFLMLDDRRKAEIGRIALLWGLVFSVVQTLGSLWMVQGTIRETMGLVRTFGGRMGGSASGGTGGGLGGGASEPKLNDPVNFPTP